MMGRIVVERQHQRAVPRSQLLPGELIERLTIKFLGACRTYALTLTVHDRDNW